METRLRPRIFDAIRVDDVEALDVFITKGFELNLVDALPGAPIHCAVEHSAFKLPQANGAHVNVRSIQRLETPIHIGGRTGHRQTYRYLLE
jgi:hypothetical protein